MPNQCCGNCKYGKFEMTRHNPPRPKNQSGRCAYEVVFDTSDLPFSIDRERVIGAYRQMLIWPDMGVGCPCWEYRA